MYKTLRELIMSFFDDYMNNEGQQTLRAYSKPIHLEAIFGPNWYEVRGDVYPIAEFIDSVKHGARVLHRRSVGGIYVCC